MQINPYICIGYTAFLLFIMKTFDFALLNQGHFRGDNWNFGPVCSGFTRIYLVDEGEAVMKFAGRSHSLKEGHIYLIPSLLTHTDHCDSVFGHYYLHFVDRSKQILNYYQKYQLPFQLDVTSDTIRCVKRLIDICPDISLNNPLPATYDTSSGTLQAIQRFQALTLGMQMEVNACLLQLLTPFFQKAEQRGRISDSRILHTLYTIGNNLNKDLSLEKLASDVHIGVHRFIGLFRQETGYTPADYIIRQRIHLAQMLFIDGNRSVKDVAVSVGYDNMPYFSRLFKKYTELSPSEFIRQNL